MERIIHDLSEILYQADNAFIEIRRNQKAEPNNRNGAEAVENDILEKSGAWYSYKGEKIGQGIASVREFIKNNPDLDEELTMQLKEKLFPSKYTETAEA